MTTDQLTSQIMNDAERDSLKAEVINTHSLLAKAVLDNTHLEQRWATLKSLLASAHEDTLSAKAEIAALRAQLVQPATAQEQS